MQVLVKMKKKNCRHLIYKSDSENICDDIQLILSLYAIIYSSILEAKRGALIK